MNGSKPEVAYFSIEIGCHPDVPTYTGGLGMLAGGTVRSAADLHVPMVAVTVLHRNGYLFQRINSDGWRIEVCIREEGGRHNVSRRVYRRLSEAVE